MRDRDDIPLETTEGRGAGNGIGDRLVVALALLALLGGALILVGKGLGGERGASASKSPQASAAASGVAEASATPRPTPVVIVLRERPLPSPEPEPPAPFSGWIRLERDLPLYEETTTGANRIGALANGALAYAEEAPSHGDGVYWLQIDVPSPNGFIAAGQDGKLFVHRYLSTPTAYGGSIGGLAASPRGFVAWGNRSTKSNLPATPFLAASTDGRAWQAVDYRPFGNAWVRSVAFGPAGWIAVGTLPNYSNGSASELWVWTSPDGRSWRALGSLPIDADQQETTLLGSGGGYLILASSYRTPTPNTATWWSSDGSTWTKGQLPDGIGPAMQHVVATRSGFYGWPDPGNGPRSEATYSADGRSWVDLAAPPISGGGRIIGIGDRLLAVDSSPVTGALRAWVGTFSNGGISWSEVVARLPRTFGFASVASDGTSVVLFGWDRPTGGLRAWSFNGIGWTEVVLAPETFGGVIPSMAVGSPLGFVALGSSMNLRADNPVLWSGTPTGGDWAPEDSPVVAPIGERTDLHCPSKPVDAAAFASLDTASAVICFGRSPITFRAYAGRCDGCGGATGDVYTPTWLADPQQNQLYLSPLKVEDGWWFNSRRAATLADDPAWLDHWVEVTGHFDDPASPTCRWTPDPHSGGVFYSSQSTINSCRMQFVVTRVRVVAGS